jgi:hypothetical protein
MAVILHAPTNIADDLNFDKSSPTQKIAQAKRWLNLGSDAPKGLLWHTYMSRVYGVSIDANIHEMEKGQVSQDWKYALRAEGLPDWCPTTLISMKENFEMGVMHKLAVSYVFGFSPFLSRDDLVTKLSKRTNDYENANKAAGGKLQYEDWYAKKIICAFGLPKNTSSDKAWRFYTRLIKVFGGVCSKKEIEDFRREKRLDVARLVVMLPASTDDSVVCHRFAGIVEAIHLESAGAPLGWKFFY